MSKRSRKHNRQQENSGMNNFDFSNFDMSQMGNLLNNINPNQLSGLLNNVDLNQVTSMLQGMGVNNSPNVEQSNYNDKRLELLNAIRPLVDADKSKLIDTMIQIYNISRIVKK
ncbi:hypothetical protein HMPREF1982_04678 [Clostridiales bacterium oral taxon 876 str. F0540]|nr:hypothetical protein HMPREF1982_04678 [Clostridiales bacterium oral taxon 876 str. F0540]